MKRQDIVDVARTWMNVRWKHMGRDRLGVDCVGLVAVVATHFEIPYKGDEVNYRRTPDGDKLIDTMKSQMIVRHGQIQPGMVVVMRDPVRPCHVGIIGTRYGELSLIHASVLKGKVYEEPWKYFKPLYRMALDYPGVED